MMLLDSQFLMSWDGILDYIHSDLLIVTGPIIVSDFVGMCARMWPIQPFVAINSCITHATTGTGRVLIMRPLALGR